MEKINKLYHFLNICRSKFIAIYLQVPGRMGLLITLFLISTNFYQTLQAPQTRGFSYIEVWMFGTQSIILLAIFEYSFILAWKKHRKSKAEVTSKQFNRKSRVKSDEQKIQMVDKFTFLASIFLLTTFNIYYWCAIN